MDYAPIGKKMNTWRKLGCVFSIPQEYIQYHEELAKESLRKLETKGFMVHAISMESTGDFDGMKTVMAVVETTTGDLKKLKWYDSHDKGYWHEKSKTGGTFYFPLDN